MPIMGVESQYTYFKSSCPSHNLNVITMPIKSKNKL